MLTRPFRALLGALSFLLVLPAALAAQGTTVPAGRRVDLVVAATTDVHGRLRGWDYDANAEDARRGLARAATIVDSLRAANPGRVVLLDAGDLLQGNAMTYVAARQPADTLHPVVAAMNAMRYDAAAIGNHEFNYGLPTLMRAVRQGRFPFLAANAWTVDGRRAFPAWRMVTRDGVKVAIVGATTPGSMVWDRDYLRGRLVMRDVVPEVRRAVDEARAARADVVLVTVHSGFDGPSSYDTVTTRVPSENVAARIAREVPFVDLIVVGHSHGEVADTTVNGVLMMQPKNWATSVAVAHLDVVRDGGAGDRWRVAGRRGALVQAAAHAEHSAVVAAVQASHDAAVRYVTTPIGRSPVAWRGDSARVADVAIHDFVLEVMRRKAGAQLAANAAFSTDTRFPAGDITVRELSRLYPYENTLRAVKVTGQQLREFLEHSARYYRQLRPGDTTALTDPRVPGYNFDVVAGVDYVLDVSQPVGSRVTRLEYRGRAVAPTDTFTMALNNYRQTGGGGYAMLAGAPVVYDGGSTEIRQLLIDEIRQKGTIRPEDYHSVNWRLEPAEAVARGHAEQNRGRPQPPAALRPPTPTKPEFTAAPAPRAGERHLRVVSINDFHGALEARPDSRGVRLGGAGAVATAIARAGAECAPGCEVILLDGGDEFQGTPASNLAFGRPVVELFNRIGVAAAALGNHEFDWGVDSLRARLREARYRIMGANVKHADGSDVPWVPDDTLVRRGALQVGIVGISTVETPRVTKASNVAGLRFVDPVPEVQARARALRARGADLVIVVAHEGGFCNQRPASPGDAPGCEGPILEIARRLGESVDAVVSGHSHSAISTLIGDVPVVQARSSGRAIGVFDLFVGPDGVRAAGAPHLRDVGTDTLPADPAADSVVRRALAALGPRINEVIGTIPADLRRGGSQHPLGNLIADAMRSVGKGDVAVMNNGGIRADLRAGQATFGTLYEVQPFGNVLYRVTVRGTALRAYMERLVRRAEPNAHVAGVRVVYDPAAPEGARVRDLFVGGRPLADDATYTVVLSDFLLTGGDGLGLQQDAVRVEPLNVVDIDALIAYVRAQPGRIVPVPADQRLVPLGR